MRVKTAIAVLALLVSATAHAMATIEFMELDSSRQYDVVKPMLTAFLRAGYKKVPDNPFALVSEIKKLAFEKGYTYQNVDEVAKEAALRLGMTRAF